MRQRRERVKDIQFDSLAGAGAQIGDAHIDLCVAQSGTRSSKIAPCNLHITKRIENIGLHLKFGSTKFDPRTVVLEFRTAYVASPRSTIEERKRSGNSNLRS